LRCLDGSITLRKAAVVNRLTKVPRHSARSGESMQHYNLLAAFTFDTMVE